MSDSKSCCGSSAAQAELSHAQTAATGSGCCGPSFKESPNEQHSDNCCAPAGRKIDYLLWGSSALVALGYLAYALGITGGHDDGWLHTASHSVFELINTMWFSVLLAVAFVGVLSQIPQSLVMSVLGKGGSFTGLLRATVAGVLMDLCSHGILMVAMKLYQKGASLGQTMAFLVASPWNSLSLTLILIALIGWQWTLAFIVLSMLLALSTGWVFDRLVAANRLPVNHQVESFEAPVQPLIQQIKQHWQNIQWNRQLFLSIAREGAAGARIVLRWLLFGVVLASLIRALVDPDVFQQYLGPTALGLAVTLIAATVIEVCSEGSAPIAADIMNRTGAPGNGFAFLMTGVATDYTEVMVIKDTMQSWKVALFLPLVTLPQVIVVAAVLNQL